MAGSFETGCAPSVIASPRSPYTRALVAASLPASQPARPPVAQAEPVLDVRDLTVSFRWRPRFFSRGGRRHVAVDGVSLSLRPGETLALSAKAAVARRRSLAPFSA